MSPYSGMAQHWCLMAKTAAAPATCRGMIDWTLQPTHRTGDMTTDMPFAAYAPGFYTAIAAMAGIRLPIYITETGICDRTSLKRPAFFRAYLDEVCTGCVLRAGSTG